MNYIYTARNVSGRFVSGRMESVSRDQALAHLQARSLCVTSLEPHHSLRGFVVGFAFLRPKNRRSQVAFFRSFATLIGAGVPIRRAIDVAVDPSRDAGLLEALNSVASDIESGSLLSAAMQRRPNEFSPLFVAMIRAGELSGTLDQVLRRLADFLERDRALRLKTSSALAYPAIVLVSAMLVVILLIANVVPTFAQMFNSMHVVLPLTTRILIAIGRALQSPRTWCLIAAVPLAIFVTVSGIRRRARTAEWWDRKLLSLPIYGPIVRRIIAARFARTLGTLLKAGVALVPALTVARDVIENASYRRRIGAVGEVLVAGGSLVVALSNARLFDPLMIQLIRVGEESGSLDSMLLRIAEYHEVDIETALATLASVLEPLLILVLGGIVGTVVASILIPLYSIIGSIK